jgi:hypothetical protein
VCVKKTTTRVRHSTRGTVQGEQETTHMGQQKIVGLMQLKKKHSPPTYWVLNGFSIVQCTNLIGRLAKSGQTNTGNVVECTDTKFGSGHGA